ncbi:MAG TPA: glutaredoxin 3 [Thermohalobaculum sp.]|nr:glutaredoxin 3 [Thermohalobaculum sp.]
MTKPIEIYTSPYCGYCFRAKHLLDSKGLAYTEIGVVGDPGARAEMIQRANGRTSVPQVFIGGTHVGGSDELHALERAGKLDPMLAAR